VFYFQQILNIAMSGIDSTSIIPTVTNIAYGILLVGFLIGLYQAVMHGGDVQALGVTAIKYLAVAIIIANWATLFRDVNGSFNSVAQFIGNSSSAGDMFKSWLDQLGQQFTSTSVSISDIISGTIATVLGTILIILAYIIYAFTIILFAFFYALYGSLLYVLGPLVLALLPMAGIGQLGKSFATNLMIWNAWGVIYSIFGALITAIHVNQVSMVGGSGFLGFFRGPAGGDSLVLGMVSIFYALSVGLIPLIAKRIISGDVGSTAMAMVNAAMTVAGLAFAGGSGLAAGAGSASAGAGASSSAGASSGAAPNNWTGTGAFGSSSSTSAATSSSNPPPIPSLGDSIQKGIASALGGDASPNSAAGHSEKSGTSQRAGGRDGSSGSGSSGSRSSGSGSVGSMYRPHGVAQVMTYQAARALGKAVGRNKSENN
jgi:hypothetical protein